MELKGRKTQAKGKRVGLMPFLLATGVASAALVAAITVPVSQKAPKKKLPTAGTESSSSSPSPKVEDSKDVALVEPERLDPVPVDVSLDEDIETLDVPSVERAKLMQRPVEEPDPRIVELGPDALDPDLDCEPPAQLTEVARSGPGALGCFVEGEHGATQMVGRVVMRNLNGTLEVGAFENGAKQGEWKTYFPSGRLSVIGEAKDGQRHGVWHEYDDQGVHRVSRSYRDGRKHGVTLRFYGLEPSIDLWSSAGQLDPETKEPLKQKVAAK